jgi:retron-type reverse transcriptase
MTKSRNSPLFIKYGTKRTLKKHGRVKTNRGSAGNDGITIEQFEQNLSQNLAEIQRLLKEKRYDPNPVLRILIPKDNGKMRKLGIPTVRVEIETQS